MVIVSDEKKKKSKNNMTKMKWETKNKINKTAVWIVLQNIFIITTSWLNIWNPFNYFWNIKSFTDSLKQQYQKKDTYLEHEGGNYFDKKTGDI